MDRAEVPAVQAARNDGQVAQDGTRLLGAPPLRRLTMANFRPNFRRATGSISIRPTVTGYCEKYSFYVPDEDRLHGGIVFSTAMNEVASTTDNLMICTNIASMLSILIPSLKPVFVMVLQELGAEAVFVNLPSGAEEHMINLSAVPQLRWPEILVHGACCVFILFKTINSANYTNYMMKRISALRSKAGCDPHRPTPMMLTLEKAVAVRNMLGAHYGLKQRMINEILNLSTMGDNVGMCFQYVCSLLSFNEMNAFAFVYETMLTTDSPVLDDPRVASETMNFMEAVKLIITQPNAQYARHTVEPNMQSLFERSRFPTLAAVAQLIKAEHLDSKSVNQFVATMDTGGRLVTSLYNLHIHSMVGRVNVATQNVRRFLTTHLDDNFF